MSTVENVAVPESLLKRVRELAKKEGISLEQFISSAVAEKAAAWMTVDYLENRAGQGSKEKFLKALRRIPDAEPEEQDRLD